MPEELVDVLELGDEEDGSLERYVGVEERVCVVLDGVLDNGVDGVLD